MYIHDATHSIHATHATHSTHSTHATHHLINPTNGTTHIPLTASTNSINLHNLHNLQYMGGDVQRKSVRRTRKRSQVDAKTGDAGSAKMTCRVVSQKGGGVLWGS